MRSTMNAAMLAGMLPMALAAHVEREPTTCNVDPGWGGPEPSITRQQRRAAERRASPKITPAEAARQNMRYRE